MKHVLYFFFFAIVITLILLLLKITDKADIDWLWVFSPIWIQILCTLVVIGFGFLINRLLQK